MRDVPRLPLEGNLDLTYRCNNNCRHCWLRIPSDSREKENELTFDEIKEIVDEARNMGCRKWSISGGEPMLRPDFADIFDYITKISVSYSLNTNGSLITPEIARLMKRKGNKMVALYGSTADVHDHITRRQGSFVSTMQGISYLKEAGVGFTLQLVPMRDNYHDFKDMVDLAKTQSPLWRTGAAWLFLSACGDPEKNREIIDQRLDPKEVIELDKPNLSHQKWAEYDENHRYAHQEREDPLFASCVALRRDFHIDPYGHMSFCCYVKVKDLRYDLRQGDFAECWERFIPSLADRVTGGKEYRDNCGSCELRSECRWCPVYGYLEHRRFSAKVEYLCAVARENRSFKARWKNNHRRYFQIAGITVSLDSTISITDYTFHTNLKRFEVDGPTEDTISISHQFFLPDTSVQELGEEVYRGVGFSVYKNGNSWIYVFPNSTSAEKLKFRLVAVFNHDHTVANVYNENDELFTKGGLASLTSLLSDQNLIARVLADRSGCCFHSGGVDLRGEGLLLIGHSGAGKSTLVQMLKDKTETLCDDQTVVRRQANGFRIHGTWWHSDVSNVSSGSAPLRAILFLEKATHNHLEPVIDKMEIIKRLLACLIKPLETADWWEKTLTVVEQIVREVDCYKLYFDKNGEVVDLLEKEFGGK